MTHDVPKTSELHDASVARLPWNLPFARWVSCYQREWLTGDIVAGVTLAAYAIPVSLAYATLAGLPSHFGNSPSVDVGAARMLSALQKDCAERGIQLRLTEAHAHVRDLLRAEGLEERVGHFGREIALEQVIAEFEPSCPMPS